MRRLLTSTALILWAGAGWAQDAALLLGTERYETLGRMSRGTEMLEAGEALRGLGFEVFSLPNGRADSTAETARDWLEQVPEANRLVVALSGRFATDGARSWFLTAEAEAPGLLTPGAAALPVEGVLRALAEAPGRSLLLIAIEPDSSNSFDPWVGEGLGALEIPQGVTVLTGSPRAVARFMTGPMVEPRADLSAAIRAADGITAQGYLPRARVFMPERAETPAAPTGSTADPAAEEALWRGTVALGTIDAYRDYLSRYPRGAHAEAAETAIAEIIAEPNRDARLAEEAIGLSRDQRRDIQRSLSLLDFNTRGIDGIFGPGTRQAITNWQQQNGFPQTSYLTPEQISRIDAQAARRAAELEAEAERQRQQAERADRSFWEETGARGDEPGLRAYLDRYPDGLFAETAADRLALIEEEKRQAAQAEDRAAWDRARGADTIEAYRDYQRAFPEGSFSAEAEARVAALTEERAQSENRAAAEAVERELGLNALTARLVEQRLDAQGLEPGTVDGEFDQSTRRAIRRYQRDHGLEASGFLDEATVVRLLADSLGDILPR
ncbi:peptidoglycan hydrolase-like protein with peptidoglycan-binding domain [Limimaricola variabilis]|uniref:Peptidoglycan hydrolase-like protein with peptidoglycan-binding domain n=1 Tax=Limimaricola variabilis TaxID=1492771 RepID=A0ABR6HLY1_9RHOB|nr:peptidoglycan-binding domain-containing protein [Limimaricola variabilis]MBB3711557.1 peptidoglycan hydrolase-like protein with peptidoglycan-binding domain [Limimaricola variabilis]